MSGKFFLKRDIVSTNAPHPDQLEVGELVLNALTGKLYTKLHGSNQIVEFVSQAICYQKTPSITFSDVSNFCCLGDLLTVTVKDLKNESANYLFEIEDLSNNSVTSLVSDAIYSPYTVFADTTSVNETPASIILRQATIPISLSISGPKPITVLKFKVILNNTPVAERTISISCRAC
jgi:hypothetical protein